MSKAYLHGCRRGSASLGYLIHLLQLLKVFLSNIWPLSLAQAAVTDHITNLTLRLPREHIYRISLGNPHNAEGCTHDLDPAVTGTTPCKYWIPPQVQLGPFHTASMVFSHKCILCKAHFRNQPGFVCCNVSQLLSRGNMKQMSSELVDREARKHSLVSKYTTLPCWISIQHSSSATASSAAAGGEWCQSAARGGKGWAQGHQQSSLLCHRVRIHLQSTKNL